MPEIQFAIVFQSVEAPQIEPMKSQANFPYDNYDLVRGKPAGVLVHINKSNMSWNAEFGLSLYINGEADWRHNCFHQPDRVMESGQENLCDFNLSDLESLGYSKFFPLPMREAFLYQPLKNLSVQVRLYPSGYENYPPCSRESSFRVNVVKTTVLSIGWTRLFAGGSCKAYNPVSIQKVRDFVDSDEIDYIFSMFPISMIRSYALKYTSGEKSYDYIKSSCNAEPAQNREDITKGLLWDVWNLENFRSRFHYHKIFAVVPDDYFIFNKKVDREGEPVAGTVIRPKWEVLDMEDYANFNWVSDFFGGSWNVAFVREDQVDQGTVAHELAHTLGQGREFYETETGPIEYCRRFKGMPFEACHKYQIPRSLRV